MKTADQLTIIYEKYLSGKHSEAELQELLDHFYVHGEESPLMDLISKELSQDLKDDEIKSSVFNIIERVDVKIEEELQKRRLPIRKSLISNKYTWIAAAASILLVAGLFFYNISLKPANELTAVDILPGTNKAFLTLQDGTKIGLSESKKGIVIDANKLRYNDGTSISNTKESNSNETSLTTLSTPKGGTYQIILSDGTKVWLNSASTLKFPARFSTSASRNVQLVGEAYFEVAKVYNTSQQKYDSNNKSKRLPFTVISKNQTILVLGTHFNVNSYEDEPVAKTTLLEGSVSVSSQTSSRVKLSPGEQSANYGNSFSVKKVDTEAAVSWIKGGFVFNEDDDLKSTMRKIARWYDVEIIYDESAPSDMEPRGWISRDNKLSAVLSRIESTGKVHFKIEGRRVTVMR